jgi:O-antigen biosynthesis protein
MSPASPSGSESLPRVKVDGKFFRAGAEKFFPKGVTYGPFAPNTSGEMFPERQQVDRDFHQIRRLGANLVRVYYVPPGWVLDAAARARLRVLIDIPWEKHRCFMETLESQQAARQTVRKAAEECAWHPALFALSVVNEIPPEIARWHGAAAVSRFIDELVQEVKDVDSEALCTFASYPPTEFLRPARIDFLTFNVYLHDREPFEQYLDRLQTLANDKPLLLGEFGFDSFREGEETRAEMLRWQVETAFRAGLAGTIIFSFTDDWFRGGQHIIDWVFGLTTRERREKLSFRAVQEAYHAAPYFPLPRVPRVSVVVASYNGAATLRTCLESLGRLNYPDYEVILVDDGSRDPTPEIAAEFPSVRTIRQENLGLSAARNTGIAAATGEIVAFTDSDCRADEDWLHYLVADMIRYEFIGIGGHNFLPPEDSPVAATVMVSPGGPAHVMLTDRLAEHIPGCNMAFYKWALDEINGFDPVFRKAGDDVDLCWRLQQHGHRIGFSAAGFVWHYRRSTMEAYLRQQAGYGDAEAILTRKHPEYFNVLGGGIWRGRIYAAGMPGVLLQRDVIYHGVFGSGFFQKLYAHEPSFGLMLCTSLQFHLFVTLPLLALGSWIEGFLLAGLAAFSASVAVCVAAALQAPLPADRKRFWSRPLVALLFYLQPIVRGWARYKSHWSAGGSTPSRPAQRVGRRADSPLCFWSERGLTRYGFLETILSRLQQAGWTHRVDNGWDRFDVEVAATRWGAAQITTAEEELARGRSFFRCRIGLRPSWWVPLSLGIVTLAALLAITLLKETQPLVWFALCAIPLVMLHIATELRTLYRDVAAEILAVADEMKLKRWQEEPEPNSPP